MKEVILSFLAMGALAAGAQQPVAGADERTPSSSQYFSWINNTNEGPTAAQTEINLHFFEWLNKRYGMQLDIYAFDAGTIDGAKMYGSMESAKFKEQFPQGFGPISRMAARQGTRLGIWGGPDGFGNTPAEAEQRIDMMVSLVRDYNFKLFKMDGVCGQLRKDKVEYFDRMMTEVRKLSPDFILLNHRLQLYDAVKHSTTFLLGGDETYIDVHMMNGVTAPHHRAKAISRKAPDNLTRLTEDHGVCISSCLDFWEDDLILQAFNRNLILAPEIYANPWFLRDEEFPYLAFIYNLHRSSRDILVRGARLDEATYGPEAITRGDGKTQFLSLRNLTWNPIKYRVKLDEEVGLTERQDVKVRLYHPYIYDLGDHAYGETIEVEVLPFRAALLKVTTAPEKDKVLLSGIPYYIINDKSGHEAEVALLGRPGETYRVKMQKGGHSFRSAQLGDKRLQALAAGKTVNVKFEGEKMKGGYHYKAAALQPCDIPADAEALYYATCFAADNNALEVRSLLRSGETKIPQVQAARDAFFNQKLFKEREIWDRNLFDGDSSTAFSIAMRWNDPRPNGASGFHLDMGEVLHLDKVVIESFDEYSISPLKSYEGVQAYVSTDLKTWKEITFVAGKRMEIDLRGIDGVRYLRFAPCPLRIAEVTGYKGGHAVNRERWRASNLFRAYGVNTACVAAQAWKNEFTLDEVHEGAYLCVAINGVHGTEGAWAALKIDGKYVGCPDRAPSFTANPWEYRSGNSDRNYTYYIPLTREMAGKKIEAYVMTLDKSPLYVNTERPDHDRKQYEARKRNLSPEVWVTSYPIPFVRKTLVLE